MISTMFTLLTLASASTIRENIEFDPYFGLEILLVTSCGVFSIILLILLAILHPPTCFCANKNQFSGIPEFPYRFLPRRPSVSSSQEGSYCTMDRDSFYISADQCRGRDNIRKKIVDTRPRMSRCEGVINSTHVPNMPEVTFNRYFPGLQEISRISNMNTLQKSPAAYKVARPYRKPRIPSKSGLPQKPLRSILKNSTNGTLPKTSTFVV